MHWCYHESPGEHTKEVYVFSYKEAVANFVFRSSKSLCAPRLADYATSKRTD